MRILAALSEKEASPSELAEEMGESLGVVSYHTRILLELKCIELVRKTPRRGAVEHHYRAIERPRDDRHLAWLNLTLDDRGWAELNEALAGVIDRAYEIQAESRERLADEDTPTSKLVLMHFEAAPETGAAAKRERR
jgi:DNA-binding transcriptional regulator GbsR (MarR family)